MYISGFPVGSPGKESACDAKDPRVRKFPWRREGYPLQYSWAFLVTQLVKNVSAMQENWVQYLGWEDSLEEGMETHSSTIAWRIPWTEEPGRLQSEGSKRVSYH